ncbi:MAG: hypothetical protein J5848_07170, partial [Bacteroidales bacterium]|nr:hypothetical protein [Bacteroidales bacterium]
VAGLLLHGDFQRDTPLYRRRRGQQSRVGRRHGRRAVPRGADGDPEGFPRHGWVLFCVVGRRLC